MENLHSMPMWLQIVISIPLIIGTFFIVVAGIGLIRLPDVFCRMHAAGKAGTLGIVMTLFAVMIYFIAIPEPDYSVLIRGLLAIFFQFLTTPAATHLLARAAYITNYPLSDRTEVDELKIFLPSRPDEAYGQE